jgi:hypothetical protein
VGTKLRIRLTVRLAAFLAILSAVAVMGQDVRTTVNPDQDFSKYGRYAWRENRIAPGSLPKEREAIEKTIKDVVNRELMKKGYAEDPQNPDFFIEVGAAALPGEMVTSANRDLRVPDNVTVYESQSAAGPGVSIWMAVTAGVRIIVTDSVSDTTAWEAVITKKVKNPDKLKNRLDKEIDSFFTKGLKSFPSNKNK